ncbi:helix-turn-helix transcriptional regulator [Leucobacter luti]|nr:LuxR C-terminal-related transcriptional regulator [Leucobacter luti]MBL3698578.1 helix-turn-helix transcriptional regulator [Leucobacter luti]
MTHSPHPDLQRALADAVAEFARETAFPLTFGGFEAAGVTTVTAMTGNHTDSLQGLRVEHSRGLGGRAMSEVRPRITSDYAHSPLITHDYDLEIGAERVRTLFAVPVVLAGDVRGVLYGATRTAVRPQTRFVQAGVAIARALAQEVKFQDEVARRVAETVSRPGPLHSHGPPDAGLAAIPSGILEELRAGHAELRQIAAETGEPETRARLAALERRLMRLGSPAPEVDQVQLAPRELDVLIHAATGLKNQEIAVALALAESTVKSYMKTAMTKLGASTRHAAVAAARRRGLIS